MLAIIATIVALSSCHSVADNPAWKGHPLESVCHIGNTDLWWNEEYVGINVDAFGNPRGSALYGVQR